MSAAQEMAEIDMMLWQALGVAEGRIASRLLYARLQTLRKRRAAWRLR